MTLRIVYPELPPSSNKIYFRGTILTKVAREYAERFSYHVTRDYLHLANELDRDAIYGVELRFYFDTLVNSSWNNPAVPEKKRAKSRYKKIDLSNRVKLLEDCIRDFMGIDDSQTFEMLTIKCQDAVNPRVEISIRTVEPDWYGI